MHVRSDALGMVDRVASTVQRRAVWEVADGIHEDGTGQWRSGSMAVRSNVLGMVDGVPSSVQRSAVWQVAHIVAELLVGIRVLLEAVLELAAVHYGSLAGWGCCRRGCRGRHGRCSRCAGAHECSCSCRWWGGRRALDGVVAGGVQGSSIDQVAHIGSIR